MGGGWGEKLTTLAPEDVNPRQAGGGEGGVLSITPTDACIINACDDMAVHVAVSPLTPARLLPTPPPVVFFHLIAVEGAVAGLGAPAAGVNMGVGGGEAAAGVNKDALRSCGCVSY